MWYCDRSYTTQIVALCEADSYYYASKLEYFTVAVSVALTSCIIKLNYNVMHICIEIQHICDFI